MLQALREARGATQEGWAARARPSRDGTNQHPEGCGDAHPGEARPLEEGHAGATYVLTGPEQITPVEQAQAIGRAIGRQIRFEELTPEQARENWLQRGWPEEVVNWLLGADDSYDWTGELPVVSPVVEQVTGRPGRTFAQWAEDHAADLR